MSSEITHLEDPHLFVDEQRFGPYRFWHHKHHIREIEAGIEMQDLVHYPLPLGSIGDMVDAGFVGQELEKIFAFRTDWLARKFGASPDRAPRHDGS